MPQKRYISLLNNLPLQKGFYPALFAEIAPSKASYFSRLWNIEEESRSLRLLSLLPLQDPFKFKARRRSHLIARFVLDQKGNFQLDVLGELISHLEKEGFIPAADGAGDREMILHFICVLKRFFAEDALRKNLKKFHVPLCHKYAESLVRDSVGKALHEPLDDVDVKIAVLSACLYPIRQNVGSCFATAPAILIQKEQLENVLYDLYELLTTGRMKRTIEGHEHTVPMCPSIGVAEMKKSIAPLIRHISNQIPFSIGYPLSQVSLLPTKMSSEEESVWWARLTQDFFEEEGSKDIDNLFEKIVLDLLNISKEERDLFLLEQSHLARRGRRVEIVHTSRVSKKEKLLQQASDTLAMVRSAFLMMTEDPLARMWEYTLASFSEVKMDFSRWNLFTSLGLRHTDTSGIGKIVYDFMEKKIEESNAKLEDYQRDYEVAFDQLRAVEVLLKQASSESEARRLKAEFQSRSYHMTACLEMRDTFYKKASFYPQFFNFFIEKLQSFFPDSFQEIYDPQMQEVNAKEYEDSPAGFRLVYKHGRRDASLWSMIYSEEQFLDALIGFFTSIEPALLSAFEEKGVQDDAKEVISRLIAHIQTKDFIDSAYKRSSAQGKQGEKKPWCYISGGVMSTLVKSYFLQQKELTQETFTIEGGLDLLTALLETLKSVPYNFTVYFPKETQKKVLMHSPTHAFLLEPYLEPFYQGWDDNGFTYTWIRDQFIEKFTRFYHSCILSEQEQRYLLLSISSLLPQEISSLLVRNIAFSGHCSPKEWAHAVIQLLPKTSHIEDLITSFLYQALPLTPKERGKEVVYSIIYDMVGSKAADLIDHLPPFSEDYISADVIKEIASGLILLSHPRLGFSFDLIEYVEKRAAEQGLSAPLPLVFADSNWSQNLLAFVVSPVSELVELWRVLGAKTQGMRISAWLPYLCQGANQPWGVYAKPQEYRTLFEQKF